MDENLIDEETDLQKLKQYTDSLNSFKRAIKTQKRKNRIETAEAIFLLCVLPCILFKYFEPESFKFILSHYAVIALYFFVKRKIKLYRIKKREKEYLKQIYKKGI